MNSMTNDYIVSEIKKVLSADFSCNIDDFDKTESIFTILKENPGRRNFPYKENGFSIMTMGKSVIVTAGEAHYQWIKNNLNEISREEFLSPRVIALLAEYAEDNDFDIMRPSQRFICSLESFKPKNINSQYNYRYYNENDIEQLFNYKGFHNALEYSTTSSRPDILAVAAFQNGQVIGIAGASKDCEKMYQIGIDVVVAHRNRGVGSSLVSQLTQIILNKGKIPYYTASVTNLGSINLCLSLGYKLLWFEINSI